MKSETIGKGLNPCSLPDGESPVLDGMDVPVSVLRHMGRDGVARLISFKDVVLVPEAVLLTTFFLITPFSLGPAGHLIASLILIQLMVFEA